MYSFKPVFTLRIRDTRHQLSQSLEQPNFAALQSQQCYFKNPEDNINFLERFGSSLLPGKSKEVSPFLEVFFTPTTGKPVFVVLARLIYFELVFHSESDLRFLTLTSFGP